ncbi:MAG: P-loop NTPase [Myxococcota bacterium]
MEGFGYAESAGTGPCVWAIGGGKGGVGKSVITSNLAIALANRGRRCVVIDVDLGGANLHTVLGMRRPARTLSHFFRSNAEDLEEVVCETPIPNLSLVTGARELLTMEAAKKQRFLEAVRRLDVDHVFLDLSAGSATCVVDFFLAARNAILVVLPEPTSIENAYQFLKASFYRSLSHATKQPSVRYVVERVLKDPEGRPSSPRELIARVSEIDRPAGRALLERVQSCSPMLIVNQARTPEHQQIGPSIANACRDFLGVEVEYVGCLEWDEKVHLAVSRREPILQLVPSAGFCRDLETLAIRLLSEETFEAGADRIEVERRYRQRRSLYDEDNLATHGLLSDDARRSQLDRIESDYADRVQEAPSIGQEPARQEPLLEWDGEEALGAYLGRCRMERGLDLNQLYQLTRLSSIEAIEAEAFELLPPEPYLQAHLRLYARTLGVPDPEGIASSYLTQVRRLRAA